MDVIEQIKYFKNAEFIISIHRSGLTNLIHTKSENCTIFEIYPQYYLDPSIRILTKVMGFNYEYIIGQTKHTSQHPQQDNVYINPNDFEAGLIKILNKNGHPLVRE